QNLVPYRYRVCDMLMNGCQASFIQIPGLECETRIAPRGRHLNVVPWAAAVKSLLYRRLSREVGYVVR
ncbi:MAG: hypothetical protein MI685_01640, partial [Chlorobiales bacterium]|nr:hypothetical protein [Chlorobiales bacterium]